MSTVDASAGEDHEGGVYALRLQGHLDQRWAGAFEGFSITHERDGTTTLQGPVIDQAALHGFLRKVRDLGLPLIAVTRVDPKPTNSSETTSSHSFRSSKKGKRR